MYGNLRQAKKDGNFCKIQILLFFVLISAFSAVSIRLFCFHHLSKEDSCSFSAEAFSLGA